MTKLSVSVLMLLVAATTAPEAVAGGCGSGDIPLGEIYLSFDSNLYDRYLGTADAPGGDPGDPLVPAFTPFAFFLLVDVDYCDCGDCGQNENRGISAWEAQLNTAGAPDLTIISAHLNPSGSTNFGSPANTNFLVGTGGTCIQGELGPFHVVTFGSLITNSLGARDQFIRLVPATPSSRHSPAWVQCAPPDGILYPFYSADDIPFNDGLDYQDGFIVLNPRVIEDVVATETVNWGRLKSGF